MTLWSVYTWSRPTATLISGQPFTLESVEGGLGHCPSPYTPPPPPSLLSCPVPPLRMTGVRQYKCSYHEYSHVYVQGCACTHTHTHMHTIHSAYRPTRRRCGSRVSLSKSVESDEVHSCPHPRDHAVPHGLDTRRRLTNTSQRHIIL